MDIYAQLTALANSRPGFDPANYGGASDYRADQRRAQRDRETALALLSHWYVRARLSPEALEAYLSRSTGRLTLRNGRLDYCAGQYYPTEYRLAIVRAITSALWDALRDQYHAERGTWDGARDYIERALKTQLPAWLYRRIKR